MTSLNAIRKTTYIHLIIAATALLISPMRAAADSTTPPDYATPGSASALYPRLASDGAGRFFAIWESDYSLYGAQSFNNGERWSQTVKIADSTIAWNGTWNLVPQAVVYAGGAWVVYYRKYKATMDVFGVLDYVTRSTDGQTWSPPTPLFQIHQILGGIYAAGDMRLATADMASDGANTIVATAGNGCFVYRSTDAGNTWTTCTMPTRIISPWGAGRFNVAYAGGQKWHITSTAPPVGWPSYDRGFSSFFTSTDNGATWTGQDTSAAFDNAGDLAARQNQVVVESHPDFVFSPDGGTTWNSTQTGIPATINSIDVNSAGQWVAGAGDNFYYTADPASGWTPTNDLAVATGTAEWPVFASNGTRFGLLRILISDPEAYFPRGTIIFQYSDDGGATWTSPEEISAQPTAATNWELFD